MLKLVIISVLALAGGPGQEVQESGAKVTTEGVVIVNLKPQVVFTHGDRQLFAVPLIVVPGLPVPQKADEPTPRGRHIEVIPPKQFNVTTGPCNMPVIVGDASVDPGILIPRTHSDGGKHKIRIVEPRACGEKVP